MTATLDAPTIRYATTADGASRRGHLLQPESARRPGGHRAALCGERRREWRPVTSMAEPGRYSACAPCTALGGPVPATPTVRIVAPAPTARRVVDAGLVPAPLVDNTQAGRVLRRAAFRDSFCRPQS